MKIKEIVDGKTLIEALRHPGCEEGEGMIFLLILNFLVGITNFYIFIKTKDNFCLIPGILCFLLSFVIAELIKKGAK